MGAGNTHKFMHNPGVATIAEGKKVAAPKKQGKNKDGKVDQKKKDDGKKGPAGPEADAKKKLKAVLKEGGKRGVEIEGAADMGGLQYFCTSIDEPEGDLELLQETMTAMNAKPIPGEE